LDCVTTPLVFEARIRASGMNGQSREGTAEVERRKRRPAARFGGPGRMAIAESPHSCTEPGVPPVLRRRCRPSSVGRVNFESPIGWRWRTEQRPHRWGGSRTSARGR
jgi:hypothetical protein